MESRFNFINNYNQLTTQQDADFEMAKLLLRYDTEIKIPAFLMGFQF